LRLQEPGSLGERHREETLLQNPSPFLSVLFRSTLHWRASCGSGEPKQWDERDEMNATLRDKICKIEEGKTNGQASSRAPMEEFKVFKAISN